MLFFICIVWTAFQVKPALLQCDVSKNSEIKEGVVGDVQIFPWIGVLRAKVFTLTESKVALTGIILVRNKYCIGYADDVVKIRKSTMEFTTRAMFIPTDQKPWYSKVKDYTVHPEYDFSTMNTIALIELDVEEYGEHVPVTPICWPPKKFNTTDLYVIGYTDENKFLEKIVYKVDFVNIESCREYYDRQQVVERINLAYPICAFAKTNRNNCEWDTGMVMVSNATGIWTMIGLSIHGPGCAAPARFIDLTKYLSWIDTSTTLEAEDTAFRKSAGDTWLHEDDSDKVDNGENGDDNFRIQQIADNAVSVEFNTTSYSGDCTISTSIVYSESMPLKSKNALFSTVLLKIPIIDLIYKNFTCVSLKVKPSTGTAYLWYNITSENSKILSNNFDKTSVWRYNTKTRLSIPTLYLKIKYESAAELKYLVHAKEKKVKLKKYSSDTKTKKILKQFKNIKKTLFKENVILESHNKLKRKIENDKIISTLKFEEKMHKINDDMKVTPRIEFPSNLLNSNTVKASNDILRTINLQCEKTSIPFPLNNQTNTANDDTNYDAKNNIGCCNNSTILNMSLSFIFFFATIYVLLGIFIKKGYVRLHL